MIHLLFSVENQTKFTTLAATSAESLAKIMIRRSSAQILVEGVVSVAMALRETQMEFVLAKEDVIKEWSLKIHSLLKK